MEVIPPGAFRCDRPAQGIGMSEFLFFPGGQLSGTERNNKKGVSNDKYDYATHCLILMLGSQKMKVYKHFTFPFLKYTSGLPLSPFPWLVALVLQLAACSSPAIHDGKKVFHYNETDRIATLDPAFAKHPSLLQPSHQLHNTLLDTDPSLPFAPS